MVARLALVPALLALVPRISWASPPCKPDGLHRPSIGLVLSGGGARGAAHIGVLRVLEELEIPIDCVVGTSMGAIVGGYYAAGWSPDEIEHEMLSTDWEQLFRGEPPRRNLSFRRKADDMHYFNFEGGLRGYHFLLPRGATASPIADFILRSKTLKVAGIDDFDKLPVPFRAVAADLVTGDAVVLKHGELSRAIRASMSIPGLFPPVEIDGRLLVDGGVVDNLPIEAARAMGAQIVIAVDVGTPLLSRSELRSLSDVALQAFALAGQHRIEEQKKLADLMIEPDLSRVTMLNFFAANVAIQSGDAAARAASDKLKKYTNPQAFAAHVAHQRRGQPEQVLRSLKVEGSERVDARRVQARVQSRAGEPLDLDKLSADLGRIVGIGEFERVDFDFEQGSDGVDLAIRPQDNDWGPTYLRAGVSITDDFEGHSSFGALLNVTRTNLNALGAEWRNEFQIGRTRRVYSEWFQPVDFSGRWFGSVSGEYGLTISDVYFMREKIAEYSVEYLLGRAEAGIEFGQYGEARVGLRRGKARANPSIGTTDLPTLDARLAGYGARLTIDQVDNVRVPRDGTLLVIDAFYSDPGLGAEFRYDKLSGEYWLFQSWNRHTAFITLSGGTSFGTDIPAYDEFVLGGVLSLSGYGEGELRGQYFGVVRPGYLYRILDPAQMLDSAIYVGGWLEAGNAWQTANEYGKDLIYTATVALAADTKFGGLYFGYGVADDGKGNLFLRLGQRF